MACQTIPGGSVGLVAADAKAHRKRADLANGEHRLDLPVAGATRNSPFDVALVGKIDVRLEVVDLDPGDGLFPLEVPPELLDFGAFGLDGFVAPHAGGDRGDAGLSGLIGSRVAKGAFHPDLGDVYRVGEGDRLIGLEFQGELVGAYS